MFWNKYPYTNFHELNLDMILRMIRELNQEWDEFKVLNTITVGGEWDITKQYPAWCIVNTNGGQEGYISVKPVPAGVDITNTDYWMSIVDYTAVIADLQNRVVALESELGARWIYATPEQFGAVGDGVTDDTAALQAALDECVASGKILLLSNKVYCHTGLTVDTGVNIMGSGMNGSVLYNTDAASDSLFINSTGGTGYFELSGFTIDGAGTSGSGLKLHYAYGVNITGVKITNHYYGIYSDLAWELNLVDSFITGNTKANVYFPYNASPSGVPIYMKNVNLGMSEYGVMVEHGMVNEFSIDGGAIGGCDIAIYFENESPCNFRNISLKNVSFEGSGAGGKILSIGSDNADAAGYIKCVEIDNCFLVNYGSTIQNAIYLNRVSNWSVKNCSFIGCTNGVYIDAISNFNGCMEMNNYESVTNQLKIGANTYTEQSGMYVDGTKVYHFIENLKSYESNLVANFYMNGFKAQAGFFKGGGTGANTYYNINHTDGASSTYLVFGRTNGNAPYGAIISTNAGTVTVFNMNSAVPITATLITGAVQISGMGTYSNLVVMGRDYNEF